MCGCGVVAAESLILLLCYVKFEIPCYYIINNNNNNWSNDAHDTLASYRAIHQSSPKSAVVEEFYGQLS